MQSICSFPACGRPVKARGYCDPHLRQEWRGEPLSALGLYKPRKARGCDFDGCDRPHYAHGYCQVHSRQLKKGQKLTPIEFRASGSIQERLDAYTVKGDGCWSWSSNHVKGYATLHYEGRMYYAHRLWYELVYGDIPEGMDIDHKCRVSGCVNPAHLQAVPHKKNGENLGVNRNSTTGVRGVHWIRAKNKYRVAVKHDYKVHYGGYFTDLDMAEAAAIALRNRLHTNNLLDRAS